METISAADEHHPIPGLLDAWGHKVTRAAIDRALNEHESRGAITGWRYGDRDAHLRTVELPEGGRLEDVTDRDAHFLVLALYAAMRAAEKAARGGEPAAAWRRCRYCHADIVAQGPRPDWAAAEPGAHPVLFCPEAPGGDSVSSVQLHEPLSGDGRRSFQLSSDPIRYGHGKQLMREVIQTDPDGHRSVLAAIPDAHSFDTWELLGRVYQLGREDLAAERAEDAGGDAWDVRFSLADLDAAQAAGLSIAELTDQARATRDHMRRWAAGQDTHPGEDAELPEGAGNPSYFGLSGPGAWRPGEGS